MSDPGVEGRRPQRSPLRQGVEGIVVVAIAAGAVALLAFLLAVLVSVLY